MCVRKFFVDWQYFNLAAHLLAREFVSYFAIQNVSENSTDNTLTSLTFKYECYDIEPKDSVFRFGLTDELDAGPA